MSQDTDSKRWAEKYVERDADRAASGEEKVYPTGDVLLDGFADAIYGALLIHEGTVLSDRDRNTRRKYTRCARAALEYGKSRFGSLGVRAMNEKPVMSDDVKANVVQAAQAIEQGRQDWQAGRPETFVTPEEMTEVRAINEQFAIPFIIPPVVYDEVKFLTAEEWEKLRLCTARAFKAGDMEIIQTPEGPTWMAVPKEYYAKE